MKSKNKKNIIPKGDEGNVKIEVYGQEVFEKIVTQSGNSGRIYLPPHWIGCHVKIIRTD